MLTYPKTVEKITESDYTAIELSYFTPTSKVPYKLAKIDCETSGEAVLALDKEVNRFPTGTKFEIVAKSTGKATTATAHTWQFSNAAEHAPGYPNPYTGQPFSGLGGFGGFGMIDANDLKEERNRLERLKESLSDLRLELTVGKMELARDREKFKEEEAKARKEIEELEKKFNSRAGMVKEGVMGVVETAIETFATEGNFGKLLGNRLAGLPNAPEPEEEELTPEEEAIQQMATEIAQQGLTLEEIKRLRGGIMATIIKMKGAVSNG